MFSVFDIAAPLARRVVSMHDRLICVVLDTNNFCQISKEPELSELAAQKAAELAQVQPIVAIDQAREILRTEPSPDIASLCWRTIALASSEQGRISDATDAIERALEFAALSGSSNVMTAARLTQSTILLDVGESALAESAALDAIRGADGLQLSRAQAQLGLILHRIGRRREALEMFDAAIPVLLAADDDRWVCRVLTNRSVHHMYEKSLVEARSDLEEALRRSESSGYVVGVVRARQNLGCVEARIGNIAAALHHFDVAHPLAVSASLAVASIESDRCEALLLGGLYIDAIDSAERAVELCREDGADADLAEAELQLARALLGAERTQDAADAAERASLRFRKQGRQRWATYADGVRHLAAPGGARDGTVAVAGGGFDSAGGELGMRLRRDGWAHLACLVDLADARRAEAEGLIPIARLLFERVVALTPAAGLDLRLRSLEASFHLARLDHDVARRPELLREARRVLEGLATTIGHELRVGLLSHHHSLVEAALDAPSLRAEPVELIQCIEQLDFTPQDLTRTHDETEPGLIEELRGLRSVLWAGASDDPSSAQRRIDELERLVLGFDRAQSNQGRLSTVPDVRRIAERHEIVVVYVTNTNGMPLVCLLHNGIARAVPFPAKARNMAMEASYLAGVVSTGLIPAAASSLQRTLGAFSQGWSDVFHGIPDDIPVVIVAGPFGALPWGLVDTIQGRPFTIVPSLTWWAEAQNRTEPTCDLRRALFVEGPDLRNVDQELEALQRAYGDVVVLRGPDATAASVLEHFRRVDVAHFAAHGEFRSDNAMLSSVHLNDGPLFARDLALVETPPKLVVFAACSTGQGRVFQAGSLGLSNLLLWAGTSAVVAPHCLIEDSQVSPLMAQFHELVAQGRTGVAGALAEVRTAHRSDPRRNHAAGTFSAFGLDFCINP